MSKIAVLDATFGDNGKGHFSHYFSNKADWVIRTTGSSNCGHVVYRDGKKYVHHYLPSADYRKKCKSFLGSGMYLHLEELLAEIEENTKDFPEAASSIYIDPDAFVITDENVSYDKEKNKHIGSTGKGVSPAATDKYARKASRVYNYIQDNAPIIKALNDKGVKFAPVLSLKREFEKSNLVFEGAQGALLDINRGIYPYVTASDCTVAGIYASGFNFFQLDRVYGVSKVGYLSKSGEGPMPTEMPPDEASYWRKMGGETGNTTGRDRRIGYLDLPMMRYGVAASGITHLILTKFDIMDGCGKIKVCNRYNKSIFSPSDFTGVVPEYIEVNGWKDSKDSKSIASFVNLIEECVGIPVEYISSGTTPRDISKVTI